MNEEWTLSAGVRYTYEEKEAKIASLGAPKDSCNIVTHNPAPCPFDFEDDDEWKSWSPKLGATYHMDDDTNIYGHWARGYRSGGYNLRNSLPTRSPGPFDEEKVDSFEVGYKSSFKRGRLNSAVFYNEISDMQREVNLPDPSAGVDISSWGYMTARASYAFRDDYAYTDNNLGFVDSIDMVDAGLDFYSGDGRWVLSVYGRNLLNETKFGGDTQLPATLGPVPLGGTFSPLARGRTYGAEITYSYF